MSPRPGPGQRDRSRQRQRTRKDLLDAAIRLLEAGGQPGLEEVAEEALVSRATAYRYFPSAEVLLLEAAMHVKVPDAGTLFGPDAPATVLQRLYRVDDAFERLILDNEGTLRSMLSLLIQPGQAAADAQVTELRRQNRRGPLLEAALAPLRDTLAPRSFQRLSRALAMVVGPESFLVTSDVLGLDRADARRLRRWIIRSLLDTAQRER